MSRWSIDPARLTDERLLAEYRESKDEAEDERQTALAAEIERRNLDF